MSDLISRDEVIKAINNMHKESESVLVYAALRNIYKTGCCNDCEIAKACQCVPKAGQMVRYNCPFYVRKDSE